MSEAKHSQTGNFGKSPLLAEPISGLMTATCYDWLTSTTHENYRSCIYSMASVMQREREAIDVGTLTNMAAGERVVTRNVSVPVA